MPTIFEDDLGGDRPDLCHYQNPIQPIMTGVHAEQRIVETWAIIVTVLGNYWGTPYARAPTSFRRSEGAQDSILFPFIETTTR